MTLPVKVVLAAAGVALALIWLFPSWIYVSEDPLFGFRATIGSFWIFDPPLHYGARLDCPKNLALSALVVLAGCALLLWSRWVRRSPPLGSRGGR
jgi:hypothetical protein